MAVYTSMKASPEAVESLRLLTLQVSAKIGRRVSMSEMLGAVCRVAGAHPDDLAAVLDSPQTVSTP